VIARTGSKVDVKIAFADRETDGSCAASTKECKPCGSGCGKGCGWRGRRDDVGGASSDESPIELVSSSFSSTTGSSGGESWWSEGMLGDLLHETAKGQREPLTRDHVIKFKTYS